MRSNTFTLSAVVDGANLTGDEPLGEDLHGGPEQAVDAMANLAVDLALVPPPELTITKTVTEVTEGDDGEVTVSYDVTVDNVGLIATTYDLDDRLNFGGGITITEATVTTADGEASTTWNGTADVAVARDVTLAAGDDHVYTVRVTATVTAEATADSADCAAGDGESGTGLLNDATVRFADIEVSDDACETVTPPTTTTSTTLAPTTTSTTAPVPTTTATSPATTTTIVPAPSSTGPTPPVTTLPLGPLPETGTDPTPFVAVAASLVAIGFVLVLRRRRLATD